MSWGGGEVVTLVVSDLGSLSLSLVKRTPPWETGAAGATQLLYRMEQFTSTPIKWLLMGLYKLSFYFS